MKKISILLAMLLVLGLFSACGGRRTALDAAAFIEKAAAAGYMLQDDTTAVNGSNAYLIAFKAGDTDVLYQFEFVVMETSELARNTYELIQPQIEESKGASSSHSTASMDNYAYYKLTSDGIYSVISRVDNTFICSISPEEYKSEIDTFLKNIGY